jgi:hypothetical protein
LLQQVLSSASELYGVGIYEKAEEQLPSTAELPHILLQKQSGDGEALFSWSVNTRASVLEPRHKELKEEFDHLFKKLLPYSNQKVRSFVLTLNPQCSSLTFLSAGVRALIYLCLGL